MKGIKSFERAKKKPNFIVIFVKDPSNDKKLAPMNEISSIIMFIILRDPFKKIKLFFCSIFEKIIFVLLIFTKNKFSIFFNFFYTLSSNLKS